MRSETQVRPDVRQFLDVRAYLDAYYQWRKATDKSFSYSVWADELGFRSRSFLRLVLVGKRTLTSSSIPLFIRSLQLRGKDAEYFENLTHFTYANSVEQRAHYSERLLKTRESTQNVTEIKDIYRFLSSPLIPKLHVLITLEGFERSEENLAKVLSASLPDMRDALCTLERLSLARREGASWIGMGELTQVKDQLGNIALQCYHRRSLENAIESINLDPAIRNYQTLLVPLSPDEYRSVVSELCAFLDALMLKYAKDSGEGRRIYQLNSCLIPVSEPILQPQNKKAAPVDQPTHPIPMLEALS